MLVTCNVGASASILRRSTRTTGAVVAALDAWLTAHPAIKCVKPKGAFYLFPYVAELLAPLGLSSTSALADALPLARIYYAVKANPAAPILSRLTALGSYYDAASWEEIEMCLASGADAAKISFGNTIKKVSAIRDLLPCLEAVAKAGKPLVKGAFQ